MRYEEVCLNSVRMGKVDFAQNLFRKEYNMRALCHYPFQCQRPVGGGGEIVSFVRKPKLLAFLPRGDPSIQTQFNRAFYHAGVKNTSGITISKARILVRIGQNGQDVTSFLAKWDFKPDPFTSYSSNAAVSPYLFVDSQVHYILPAVAETFKLFLKVQGETELYTFSPFSYIYPTLKCPPALQLGEYSVEVMVAAGELPRGFWPENGKLWHVI
ncbi:MAG: hypothetical protein QXV32_02135 [Conexivisphaerales archaeon]